MYIEHGLKYYGVGQGLFVHGTVRLFHSKPDQKINYIYDCGGLKARLEDNIDRVSYELDGKPLDILFLSHLHNDHISGLDHLLRKLSGGVKMVVLPYLYPAERAALRGYGLDAGDATEGPDEWYNTFLEAPGSYLREMGVQNIHFIRGGDGPGNEESQEGDYWPPLWPQGDEGSQERDDQVEGQIAAMVAYPAPEQIVTICRDEEEKISGESVDSLENLLNSRSGIRAGRWFFLLFNKEVPTSQLDTFQKKFENIRDGSSLRDVLTDHNKLKRVQEAYKKLVGCSDLNVSSLAVLSACHIPRGRPRLIDWRADTETDVYYNNCCGRHHHHHHHHHHWHHWRCYPHHPHCICDRDPGFVFTGDLPVNIDWGFFSRKFGLEDNVVTMTYQVPHHGSQHNWHPTQADIADPIYVVSAGRHRKNHPDASVLGDIARADRALAWVHENSSFTQKTIIEWHP